MRPINTAVLVASIFASGGKAMAIEQPTYRVVEQRDNLEIRQYDPYIVAETRVEGAFDDAGNEGFTRLLRYITGANRSRAEISMTAPVAQVGDGAGHWVSFMMPSQFTLETLPQPSDARIRLRAVADAAAASAGHRARGEAAAHGLRPYALSPGRASG